MGGLMDSEWISTWERFLDQPLPIRGVKDAKNHPVLSWIHDAETMPTLSTLSPQEDILGICMALALSCLWLRDLNEGLSPGHRTFTQGELIETQVLIAILPDEYWTPSAIKVTKRDMFRALHEEYGCIFPYIFGGVR